jgi:2-iminobutanoate/2-iminopropanoate deaminase
MDGVRNASSALLALRLIEGDHGMGRRQSIYTESFSHSNPIPAACRLGDLLVSGIINGLDPTRPGTPGTMDEQCALMFARIREIMATAGGSIDDIAKINVWVADIRDREPLNRHWVDMFPDPEDRPVRQTTQIALDRGKLIQCDILARLSTAEA